MLDAKHKVRAAKSIQADEIWSFSYAKQKNVKFAKSAPSASATCRRRRRADRAFRSNHNHETRRQGAAFLC
jgi:hypothetical protein